MSKSDAATLITRAARAFIVRRAGTQDLSCGAGTNSSRRYTNYGSSECRRRLFVGHLNSITTSSGLKEYFSQFGTVEDTVVVTDRTTGKSRGFGFVSFAEIKGTGRGMIAVRWSRPSPSPCACVSSSAVSMHGS